MGSTIKFAVDGEKYIHIDDAVGGKEYQCPDANCGGVLIVKADPNATFKKYQKDKHFAHKHGTNHDIGSTGMSALHSEAQKVIANRFKYNLEERYADSEFVSDVGSRSESEYYDVVVSHDIAGEKKKFIFDTIKKTIDHESLPAIKKTDFKFNVYRIDLSDVDDESAAYFVSNEDKLIQLVLQRKVSLNNVVYRQLQASFKPKVVDYFTSQRQKQAATIGDNKSLSSEIQHRSQFNLTKSSSFNPSVNHINKITHFEPVVIKDDKYWANRLEQDYKRIFINGTKWSEL